MKHTCVICKCVDLVVIDIAGKLREEYLNWNAAKKCVIYKKWKLKQKIHLLKLPPTVLIDR